MRRRFRASYTNLDAASVINRLKRRLTRWEFRSRASRCLLVTSAFSLLAASQAQAEPLFFFNSAPDGRPQRCAVDEYNPLRAKLTAQAIDKAAIFSSSQILNGPHKVFVQRVRWSNGRHFTNMATDNYLYCLSSYQKWNSVMLAEMADTIAYEHQQLSSVSGSSTSRPLGRAPTATEHERREACSTESNNSSANVDCLSRQATASREKLVHELDALGSLDARSAKPLETINRRWSDLQDDQCALAQDQVASLRCEIKIYDLRAEMLNEATRRASIKKLR